jgi:hypothetical protein
MYIREKRISKKYMLNSLYVKHGVKETASNPQIANPQILGLFPQSQIREFLRCASPQIANPQICKKKKQLF